MLVSDLFTIVRYSNQDQDGVTWTDANLLSFYNAAVKTVCQVKPSLCAVIKPLSLSAGSAQSLTSTDYRLLGIIHNIISTPVETYSLTIGQKVSDPPLDYIGYGGPPLYNYGDLSPVEFMGVSIMQLGEGLLNPLLWIVPHDGAGTIIQIPGVDAIKMTMGGFSQTYNWIDGFGYLDLVGNADMQSYLVANLGNTVEITLEDVT